MMAKFKRGQLVVYKDEPDLYSIRAVLEFPNSPGALYSIRKIGSDEDSKLANERNLTAVKATINEEDKTMATTTNKSYDYTATTTKKILAQAFDYDECPEEVEFDKKRKELIDEAEKKILDIRHELALALDKLDKERFEQDMQRNEEAQAKMWKRKYDALLKEGFSVEQAWEMTMESFKIY